MTRRRRPLSNAGVTGPRPGDLPVARRLGGFLTAPGVLDFVGERKGWFPMQHDTPAPLTLDDWIARDAIPFSPDSPGAAVDRLVAALGGPVELLALGECLHGEPAFLTLRNRIFRHLVEVHGYTAIALESSFPRGRLVDEYVAGRGDDAAYDAVQDAGFSHGFGRLAGSRDLVEWMRAYNADPAHPAKLRFYGCDAPTEMSGADSPRRLLHVALDYLASVRPATDDDIDQRRRRMDGLLGPDDAWSNPAASFDPAQAVGLSPAAASLRLETEDLLTELLLRRPDLIPATGEARHTDAVHCASAARHLLTYHAVLAGTAPDRIARLLGIRDLMMADNLAHMAARERARGGRLFAFAHNHHLQRGQALWQLGPHALAWWPAGAHLGHTLGPGRYAVIGSALGSSASIDLAAPEPGTLEHYLTTGSPGPARFLPIRPARSLPPDALASIPVRPAAAKNPTYFPLTPQSVVGFDAVLALDSTPCA